MLSRWLSFSVASLTLSFAAISGAEAQSGWAEQRPVQFRYSDQGMTNEVYRNQLGVSAAAAAATVAISSRDGASGGGSGSGGQSSGQLQNVIQVNPIISNTGSGNVYLNIGDVNGAQTSTDSNQTSTNTSQTARKGGSIVLNP